MTDLRTIVSKNVEQYQDTFIRMYPEFRYQTEGKGDSDTPTRDITFVVTEDCNLRCTYCYQHHKNGNNKMTFEVAKKAVDMLFEEDAKKDGRYINEKNSRAIILEFIGGEPLLEIDLIEQIVEYFRYKAITLRHRWAMHHMISMTTNGVLYNTPKVRRFVEKYNERLSIGITIDGNKELHDSCRLFMDGTGSYDIVEASFKEYLKGKVDARTKLTLAPANILHYGDACIHLFDMGLKVVHANCVYERGWQREHGKILYQEMMKIAEWLLEDDRYEEYMTTMFDETLGQSLDENFNENWCGGTGKMLAIDSKGKVYPCLRYLPFNLKAGLDPIVIGDVENGIESTEDEKAVVDMLKGITRRSQSTDECYGCPIGLGCGWCSAYNYEEFGTPNKRATFLCITHKARVLANIAFWNKVYEKRGMNYRKEVTIPREWALEVVSEKEFSEIVNNSILR